MVQGPGRQAHGHESESAAHIHPPGMEHSHGPEHDHDHHGFVATAKAIGLSQRARRLRMGLLVTVFTLATVTLLAELGLRLTRDPVQALERSLSHTNRRWVELSRAHVFEEVADPVRRYALRPGTDVDVDGFHFRTSAQGTRGANVPAEKPVDERRLLCLGDSFAFGLWCQGDETLVAQLAAGATKRETELGTGLTWRGINLGVPGYHLGQTLAAFEEQGLALEPDLVLLYFNTNDIEQSGFYYDNELGVLRRDFLPLPDILKRTLWRWSRLYGWIAARHARAVESGPLPYLEPRVPWAHVRADNQDYTRARLARIQALCRERSLPLVIVNQPLMTFLGSTRAQDWPVLPLDDWIRGVCAELELPTLHLLGWLRGYGDNVDRLAEGAEPDSLTDQYIADERLQAILTQARERAKAAGVVWAELSYPEQLGFFAGVAAEIPAAPDFHLTAEGYAHIARLAHSFLQAEGFLP